MRFRGASLTPRAHCTPPPSPSASGAGAEVPERGHAPVPRGLLAERRPQLLRSALPWSPAADLGGRWTSSERVETKIETRMGVAGAAKGACERGTSDAALVSAGGLPAPRPRPTRTPHAHVDAHAPRGRPTHAPPRRPTPTPHTEAPRGCALQRQVSEACPPARRGPSSMPPPSPGAVCVRRPSSAGDRKDFTDPRRAVRVGGCFSPGQ